jgi:hypothetical protein
MIENILSYVNTTNAVIALSAIVGTALVVKVTKLAIPVLKDLGNKFFHSKFFTRCIIPFHSESVSRLYVERNCKKYNGLESKNITEIKT